MRILFTTQAMPSHFYPLRSIALPAVASGHTVAFATGPKLAPLVEDAGFTCYVVGANPDDADVEAVVRETFSRPESEHGDLVFTELFGGILADRALPHLQQVIERFRPDIIVSEAFELVGRVLAESHQLPSATLLYGLLPTPEQLAGGLGQANARLRRKLGLNGPSPTASYTRSLKLVLAPRSYQHPEVEVGPDVRFFRPDGPESTVDELPDWVDALLHKPIVYGTLGTVAAFNAQKGALRAVIDAIGSCDVHGIVTCGRNQDPAGFGPLPSNVRVEQFIPQAHLMQRCSAVVSHAGYGTTIGTLSFGVPMVMAPFGADQPEHAQRCEELGVARVVWPATFGPDALASALQNVLREPSYAARARALQAELAALPGRDRAVAELAAWSERRQVA